MERAGAECGLGLLAAGAGVVSGGHAKIEGLRVFVVEDEIAALLMLENMLEQLGCRLAGSAARLSDALRQAADVAADVAVLDININNEPIFPVAERLLARGLPVVFATGYATAAMEAHWRRWPMLQKPYGTDELGKAIAWAMTKASARG